MTDVWTLVDGTSVARVRLAMCLSTHAGQLLPSVVLQGLAIALLPGWFAEKDLKLRRLKSVKNL